jgi:hypothetical protein
MELICFFHFYTVAHLLCAKNSVQENRFYLDQERPHWHRCDLRIYVSGLVKLCSLVFIFCGVKLSVTFKSYGVLVVAVFSVAVLKQCYMWF